MPFTNRIEANWHLYMYKIVIIYLYIEANYKKKDI